MLFRSLNYIQPTLEQGLTFIGIVVLISITKTFIELYADILESRDRLNRK